MSGWSSLYGSYEVEVGKCRRHGDPRPGCRATPRSVPLFFSSFFLLFSPLAAGVARTLRQHSHDQKMPLLRGIKLGVESVTVSVTLTGPREPHDYRVRDPWVPECRVNPNHERITHPQKGSPPKNVEFTRRAGPWSRQRGWCRGRRLLGCRRCPRSASRG